MLDSYAILRLYTNVLHDDIKTCGISHQAIRMGIQDMADVYKPDPTSLGKYITDRKFTDFNIAAFRCAYLHKYAPLHTYIVLDIMMKILNEQAILFRNLLNSRQLKLCCLGGGPGSDAIGVLAALHAEFASLKSSVTIIDSMEQWKFTFNSILNHLKYSPGLATNWVNNIEWNYIGADLLLDMNNVINKAIGSASFVTMVKFVSAATCTDTEPMVEKIFRIMKPGALVLYIDNAAGGFTQIIQRAGKKYSFKTIAGPYRHMEYSNEDLKVERFGYTSCFKTTVTIILLQKPHPNKKSASQRNSSSQSVLRDVQNINKVPKQTPVAAQGKINKSLFPNSNIIPTPSRSNINENRIQPPSSNANVVKPSRAISNENRVQTPYSYAPVRVNNLNFNSQYERFYAQSGSSSPTTPDYDVYSQPRATIHTQPRAIANTQPRATTYTQPRATAYAREDSYTESIDDTNDNCCSCCVIS